MLHYLFRTISKQLFESGKFIYNWEEDYMIALSLSLSLSDKLLSILRSLTHGNIPILHTQEDKTLNQSF